jgi:MSHA biogenesis protein MshQ
LTYSSGSGLRFTRSAEEVPFDADIQLSAILADSDGAADLGNPLTFGDAGGIIFDSGATMRYGRARFFNAYGSELVDLALPLRTEYYVDAATGFVPNTSDACATVAGVTLGSFTENLTGADTCVHDTGQPGVSGAGCPFAGPPALRFRSPTLGGDFNLHLRAPGAGHDGSTTATADVSSWLEYDWNGSSPGNEDPGGTAVFGIYEGQERRIYIRELY